jgi:hypothetical protein
MRVERVGLEYHGQAALGGCNVVDLQAVHINLTRRDCLQAGDHPQQRGFPTAGRADKHHEFAVFDIQIDTVDDFDRAEAFHDVFQFQARHQTNSLFRPGCQPA